MTLFQPLVLTRLGSLHYSSCSYWLLINSARIPQRRNLYKGFYSVLIQSRPHVSYSTTDEKSLSDCAELAGMHKSLRAVSDIMGYSVACFSQNCSGLPKLSRWHLQTFITIVSSPDRCGFNTNSSLFSRKRLSISTVFGSDFYDQFIKNYRGSQVPAHWCFYDRTGEREMGYKGLMIVCRRSSASNDNIDGNMSTVDAANN